LAERRAEGGVTGLPLALHVAAVDGIEQAPQTGEQR
jgi:hypothetical protein